MIDKQRFMIDPQDTNLAYQIHKSVVDDVLIYATHEGRVYAEPFRFEYEIYIPRPEQGLSDIITLLNHFGKDRWELASVADILGESLFIFKRAIVEGHNETT